MEAFTRQTIVAGNLALPAELKQAEPAKARNRETLIQSGDADNDFYFALAESVAIVANGKAARRRGPRHRWRNGCRQALGSGFRSSFKEAAWQVEHGTRN